MRRLFIGAISAFALGFNPASGWAVNGCCINTVCSYAANLTTGSVPLTSLCGTTLSGTNCVITMGQDESIGSGDCAAIGDDTTLNMNGHSITCTGATCGTALILNDATTGNTTKINGPGLIEGCWHTGASVANTATNPTITDVTVDVHNTGFACTAPGGQFGLGDSAGGASGRFKTMTRNVVGYATNIGVWAGASTSIVDSIVHDSGTGVSVTASSPSVGTSIAGSLIIDCAASIQNITSTAADGGPATLDDSTLRNASAGHFYTFQNIPGPSTSVIKLLGTTFIDNEILH